MAKAPQKIEPKMTARLKIVEAITTPLGFFVLALLIVESFLATVLVGANLQGNDKMTCVWLGVILFVVVVAIVAYLVCNHPSNLTFDKEAHLVDRGKTPYGSEQQLVKVDALFSSSKREEAI